MGQKLIMTDDNRQLIDLMLTEYLEEKTNATFTLLANKIKTLTEKNKLLITYINKCTAILLDIGYTEQDIINIITKKSEKTPEVCILGDLHE